MGRAVKDAFATQSSESVSLAFSTLCYALSHGFVCHMYGELNYFEELPHFDHCKSVADQRPGSDYIIIF